MSIAVLHTYYVLAGNTPVLVHNEGVCGWRSDFDSLPRGDQKHVREVGSVKELRGLFDKWIVGAQRLPPRGDKVPEVYKLKDGTVIQWRRSSLSGGESIDIFVPGRKRELKVHLPKKK